MNRIEWLNQFVLRNYFSASNFCQRDYVYEYFEVYHADWNVYFPSHFQGRIVYKDNHGKQRYSKTISIHVIEEEDERPSDNVFFVSKEILAHTRVIPFFSSLSSSIYNIVPKVLYFSAALRKDEEDAIWIMDNLEEEGTFQKPILKEAFYNLPHLEILMKKLGEFHAFSYQTKNIKPEIFRMQFGSAKPDKLIETNEYFVYRRLLIEHFLPLLSKDKRYAEKSQTIQTILEELNKILEVFYSVDESVSVLNIGALYEPSLLFKYDARNIPTSVKFSFLRYCTYCTPVLDIGFVLYIQADQNIRDKYWDHLIDVYYTSLRNTFPESEAIPEKSRILNEFKGKSLYMFWFSVLVLPYVMEKAENPNLNWYPMLYPKKFEEYKYHNWYNIPTEVRVTTTEKLLKRKHNNSEQNILNILKDIIDRGFI